MTFDHGLDGSMAGDYASVVYWYQLEPHATFTALPSVPERRPRLPWSSPAQWLLLTLLLLLLPVLIYALCRAA